MLPPKTGCAGISPLPRATWGRPLVVVVVVVVDVDVDVDGVVVGVGDGDGAVSRRRGLLGPPAAC
jgi:hypothetical protein